MTNNIEAQVVSTPTDSLPDPGPFPDLYVTTSWSWRLDYRGLKHEWRACMSMFPRTLHDIQNEATDLIATGHRNVRIVRIPGYLPDPPAQQHTQGDTR